jgi:hypothetical protein
MERRLPNIFNYLRTFPLQQFATLERGFHFKNLHKTGHVISEIAGHNAEINGHDRVKYATQAPEFLWVVAHRPRYPKKKIRFQPSGSSARQRKSFHLDSDRDPDSSAVQYATNALPWRLAP